MSNRDTGNLTAGSTLAAPRYAWWVKSMDLRNAAVRIRAAIVLRAAAQRGVAIEWFKEEDAQHYRCVVVSGRHDDETLLRLHRLKQNGGRLVLDLCDNHFIPASQRHKHLHRCENVRALAAMANAIVTSSDTLAQIVRRECPTADRIVTIGDPPDDLSIVKTPLWHRYVSNWQLSRESAYLNRVAPAKVARLIWFGASGGHRKLSGLIDLARIAPMISKLAQTHPVHLTVITDNLKLHQECIEPILPSSRYIAWNPRTFDSLLRQQHIVLIPAQSNEYTACKSDNRVVTALRAGLAVVAETVPSYAPYAGTIMLGNLEEGLQRYLTDPALRVADASRGQAMVMEADTTELVLSQWLDLLSCI